MRVEHGPRPDSKSPWAKGEETSKGRPENIPRHDSEEENRDLANPQTSSEGARSGQEARRSRHVNFYYLPPMFTDKPGKNTLSIRLAESAVFLRTNDFTGRSRDSRPALLRGLLVLDLVKPTKISSIELELTAKTSTSWPEGIGARRLEVTEDHTVFAATTIFFKAGPTPRRTASIGPGTHDEAVRDDWDDEPQHTTLPRRTDEHRGRLDTSDRASRRISLDSSVFQRYPVSHHEDHRLTQTPPYSPQSASPLTTPLMSPMERSASTLYSPHTSLRQDESPAQTLEDLRNALFDHSTSCQPICPLRVDSSCKSRRSP
ncbi:Arrestin-C domain-containing protein [Salix suchowensis]|nr:Arrestin-C domain-containing protein [Salix suchowensis]